MENDILERMKNLSQAFIKLQPIPNYEVMVAIEELSELQKELTKYIRNKGDSDHIAEEMGDVLITIVTAMIICGVNKDDILKHVEEKLIKYEDKIRDVLLCYNRAEDPKIML